MHLPFIPPSITLFFFGLAGLLFLFSYLAKKATSASKHPRLIWLIDSLGAATALLAVSALLSWNLNPNLRVFESIMKLLDTAWYILGAWILVRLIEAYFWKSKPSKTKNRRVPPRVLFHLSSVLISIITALIISQKVFRIDIPTELIVSSGVLAALIGFSAKDILSDMVAGLILSFDRPFRTGDWIELDDGKTLGEVRDISWRVTKVVTWFNTVKEIPNSSILKQTVNNLSGPDPSYGHWFYIYMPSDVSISLTRRTLLQACFDCDYVLEDPVPVVRISEMEHRPYKYMIYVHFADYPNYFKGKDRLLAEINNALAKEKIPVPAKTRDVDIYQLKHERVPILEYSSKQLIKKVKIFQLLDDAHCDLLLDEMKVLSFDVGDTILDVGDTNDALYILAFGKVKVERGFPDGSQHVIEKIYPGNYFGVMSLLASEPSPDRYTAMGECQVLEFKQSSLESIFNDHPEMMEEVANFLAKQKFQRMAKLSALTQSDKKQRGDRSLRQYGKEFLASIQKSFMDES